jgi:hypothetical protein
MKKTLTLSLFSVLMIALSACSTSPDYESETTINQDQFLNQQEVLETDPDTQTDIESSQTSPIQQEADEILSDLESLNNDQDFPPLTEDELLLE